MNVLFQLPPELIEKTLSYLSPDDLTYKFELNNLIHDRKHDSYYKIRQIAFLVKYKGKNITISNIDTNNTLQLSNDQLQYLFTMKMIIKPEEISFILFDCNNSFSYSYSHFMLNHHLNLVKSFANKFSFQLNINDNNLMDTNFLNGIFYHFNNCEYIVNWFSINYKTVKQSFEPKHNSFSKNDYHLNLSNVENLKLHLFNSSRLMEHFEYFKNHNCYRCGSLKTLDLSYNNISDENLKKLHFPSLIEYLNLSNNNIHIISNNFNISNLTNLKNLNLSNNNLIKISNNINISCKLEVLILSGNNLNNCNFLSIPFFQNLLDLDISRNLISKIDNLPTTLEKLDLSGNYLTAFFNEQNWSVFPSSLVELNLSWCKILFKANFNVIESRRTLQSQHLYKLKSLTLSGNKYYNIGSEVLQVCK